MRNLISVSGLRGAGKDIVVNAILKNEEFSRIVPFTTRPKRDVETHTKEYYFINEKNLEDIRKNDDILYQVNLGDYIYGTTISEFNRHENGVIDITVEGARKLRYFSLNDLTLYIFAREEIRRERIMRRQGLSEREALTLMQIEPSPGELKTLIKEYPDFLILKNNASLEYIQKLAQIVAATFLKASVFK